MTSVISPTSTVSVDVMRDKLWDLDTAYTKLSTTEPVITQPLVVGDTVSFIVNDGWNDELEEKSPTDLVDAFVNIRGGDTYQLTKEAISAIGTNKTGLKQSNLNTAPGWLTQRNLNYWYQQGLAGQDFQLLMTGDTVSALTAKSIVPFSNVRLLERVVLGLQERFGLTEILVDYKFSHTLNETYVRLVLPEVARTLIDTGTDDDTWSLGVQFRNSLMGANQTAVSGYLFCWTCTNGNTCTHASAQQVWNRKKGGQDPEKVYDWARTSVDEVLGGLEGALDEVQALAYEDITGEVNVTAQEIMTQYKIPQAQRNRIVEILLDEPTDTMYSLMQAITAAANESGMDPAQVARLLHVGGDLPHASNIRCDKGRIHIS